MYITRGSINGACCDVLTYFEENRMELETKCREYAKNYVRNDNVIIDHYHPFKLLCSDNIYLFYDKEGGHWAETDGETIGLNTYKVWTRKLLINTLKHEALHGYIKRLNKYGNTYCIPEEKEHGIMFELDKELI